MRILTWTIAMFVLAGAAGAADPGIGDEAQATEQARQEAQQSSEAAARAGDAEEEEAFEPPPGYRIKRFGNKVLYCIKDATVGTRFKTEKCYDRIQLKELLLAQQQNKTDMDRTRSVCSNPGICAPQ